MKWLVVTYRSSPLVWVSKMDGGLPEFLFHVNTPAVPMGTLPMGTQRYPAVLSGTQRYPAVPSGTQRYQVMFSRTIPTHTSSEFSKAPAQYSSGTTAAAAAQQQRHNNSSGTTAGAVQHQRTSHRLIYPYRKACLLCTPFFISRHPRDFQVNHNPQGFCLHIYTPTVLTFPPTVVLWSYGTCY